MDTVTLLPQSIPRIWFAHEYGSREYDIRFPVMADRLESCHLIEGMLAGSRAAVLCGYRGDR